MVETLQEIQILVDTLNNSHDQYRRKEADSKLKEFQETKFAWQIANEILANSSSFSLECQLFAAQTLRRKVCHDVMDLDDFSRRSLLEALVKFMQNASVHRLILSQISLALAYLTINLNCFQQVFGLFSANNAILLTFLSSFAEALPIAKQPVISATDLDLIFQFLFSAAQAQSDYAMVALETLVFFLKSDLVSCDQLARYPFVSFAFSALAHEECLDLAIDLICEIVHYTKKLPANTGIQYEVHVKLQQNQQYLYELAKNCPDQQKSICRLYVLVGEMVVGNILQFPNELNYIVHGILFCTGFKDLEVVPMTFNFWADFTDELLLRDNGNGRQFYSTVFEQLMDIMISHLQYPSDLNSWSAAERDDFRDFRHVMGDVLKDCCRIIGEERALAKVDGLINSLLLSSAGNAPWQSLEACLFALRALGSVVSPNEDKFMPKIMEFLLSQSNSHAKIQYASTLVIGRYSDWTKNHPHFIARQLQYISLGFNNSEVISASALALNYLCQSCDMLMLPYINDLLPFYVSCVDRVSRHDMIELTQAMACLIKASSDQDISQLLEAFTNPLLSKLQTISQKEFDSSARTQFEDTLYLLSLFFKFVNNASSVQALCKLFSNSLSLIDACTTQCPQETIFEAVMRYLKMAMITLDNGFRQFLPSLLLFLTSSYQKHRYPCILWIASQIIKKFSNKQDDFTFSALQTFTMSMITETLGHCADLSKFEDEPEAFEDMTLFLSTSATHMPHIIYQLETSKRIMVLLINGLSQPHMLVHENSIRTLKHFMEGLGAVSTENTSTLLKEYGQTLIEKIFSGLFGINAYGFCFSSSINLDISFIIVNLCLVIPDVFGWVEMYLGSTRNQYGEEKLPETTCSNFLKSLKESVQTRDPNMLKFAIASLISSFRGPGARRRKVQ